MFKKVTKVKIGVAILAIILILILFFYKILQQISPGLYQFAKNYELNVNKTKFIEIVENFKKENPYYSPPTEIELIDGPLNNFKNYYVFYFYFPEEKQILYTYALQIDKNLTKFGLVSINDGLVLGNWKSINHDFVSSENVEIIQKFEKRILDKIKREAETIK